MPTFKTASSAMFFLASLASYNIASSDSSNLNDTGILWSGLVPTGIADCKEAKEKQTQNFVAQQDCATGRDQSAFYGAQIETGFSYTKLDKNGDALAKTAPEWYCVKDEISGLNWQVKTEKAGTHAASDQYTWYNSNRNQNGGHIGDWNSRGDHCEGYQAGKPKTYCHAEQYAYRVNQEGLCGHNDWRLPTRAELANLVHFGRIKPAIETDYFPNTQSGFYWTATSVSGRNKEAWAISFEYGFSAPMPRTDSRFIRLVRDDNIRSK